MKAATGRRRMRGGYLRRHPGRPQGDPGSIPERIRLRFRNGSRISASLRPGWPVFP